jgi:hypothetical protein
MQIVATSITQSQIIAVMRKLASATARCLTQRAAAEALQVGGLIFEELPLGRLLRFV